MDNLKETEFFVETQAISEFIKELLINNKSLYDNLSFVSLGSGDGRKDVAILNNVLEYTKLTSAHDYFLVEISPYLLLLSSHMLDSNFVKESNDDFIREDYPKINPVLIDFFNLDFLRENHKKLFESKKRLFFLLGQTFGNYRELDLLKQIIKIMEVGDLLFIGLEIHSEFADEIKKSADKELKKKEIQQQYRMPENQKFLLEPITLIPSYSNIIENRSIKILHKFSDSVIESFGKKLSDVNDTYAYCAQLDITGIGTSYIGWSHKYCKESIDSFFNNLINQSIPLRLIKYINTFQKNHEIYTTNYYVYILEKIELIVEKKKIEYTPPKP